MARVLISMADEFLNKIDEVADKEQRSRSELIREALRTYMRKATFISRTYDHDANAKLLESIL